MYQFTYSKPVAGQENSVTTETIEYPICKVYYGYMTGFGYLLEQGFSYMIVILSYVIRFFFIWVAGKVRFFSKTKETIFIMISVFWIYFLNYGIVYLFASWDSRHWILNFINKLFEGLYPDFTALWFNDVGRLLVAIMISNMYWPPLEFFLYWG